MKYEAVKRNDAKQGLSTRSRTDKHAGSKCFPSVFEGKHFMLLDCMPWDDVMGWLG
jgi:hypothetical protein